MQIDYKRDLNHTYVILQEEKEMLEALDVLIVEDDRKTAEHLEKYLKKQEKLLRKSIKWCIFVVSFFIELDF